MHPKDATTSAEAPRGNAFRSEEERCLARLREGATYCYRGVNLWLAPDGYLEVRVHPDWRDDAPGAGSPPDDASYARLVLAGAASTCPELGELMSNRPWRFVRIHDDETGFTSHLYLRDDGILAWSVALL